MDLNASTASVTHVVKKRVTKVRSLTNICAETNARVRLCAHELQTTLQCAAGRVGGAGSGKEN